jgi:hypothetical protein
VGWTPFRVAIDGSRLVMTNFPWGCICLRQGCTTTKMGLTGFLQDNVRILKVFGLIMQQPRRPRGLTGPQH